MLLKQPKFNYKRKDRRKTVKVIFQLAILMFLTVVLIRAVFITGNYKPLAVEDMNNIDGFVSLSYFGVDRSGSAKYISKDELNKQLVHLKDMGFETISQQQIIDFYQDGTPLPERALFLSFEDGRNDSSIFSQKTLEALNYQATMFTYADKMATKDTKFLKPRHLKQMINSGYWELGSNGYQLTYINIFNGEGEYLGKIAENDVPDKTLIEYYNHYLMDFLRDEYMIPKETRVEMIERITSDYDQMKTIYSRSFETFPKAYAIMHANSLYNNMHQDVEKINDRKIKEYFSLHFNRDHYAYNDKDASPYNLNRLQVAPHWPPNHLLMKIGQDSEWEMDFVLGDTAIADQWIVENGVGEFDKERIILTSNPDKEVTAILEQSLPVTFTAKLNLSGNINGRQSVSLRSEDSQAQLEFAFEKNILYIYRSQLNEEKLRLAEIPLDEINWSGEDYAFNKATQYTYADTLSGSRIDEDEYPSTLKNDRQVEVVLKGDQLTLRVDQKNLAEIEMLGTDSTYQLVLGGVIAQSNTSHEQDIDTIYDSIIEDLTIQSGEELLYTTHETKFKIITRQLTKTYSDIVDFFIETF